MNDPRYSEDEETERLKQWWKKNGTSVIVGAALGVSAIVGVNYWRDYVTTQAENASARFADVLSAEGNQSVQAAEELLVDYESTPYAALAALYIAKVSYEQGDVEKAESTLRGVLDKSKQPATRHVARLRLARVHLDMGKVAEAEALTKVDRYEGFESEYKELIGDIAMLKGDVEVARDAYQQAMSKLPAGSGFSKLLVLKLDHATGESAQ